MPGPRSQVLVFAALALAAFPAQAVDAQYLVDARTELRTRNTQPGSTGVLTQEFELRPSAGLLLGSDDARLGVAYRPSLIFRDPFALGPVALLHRGVLDFSWRFPRVTVTAQADGSWGTNDLSAIRPQDSQAAGSVEVPTLGLVPWVRLYGRAGLDAVVTTRVTLGGDAGYQLSGSTDARPDLPLQQGPFATLRLRWAPRPQDSLTTSVLGAHAWFYRASFTVTPVPVPPATTPTPLPRTEVQTVAQALESWQHTFTPRTSLTATAGVAFTREQVREEVRFEGFDGPTSSTQLLYTEVLPVAALSGSHRLVGGGTVDLRATVRVGPFADRYTGAVYERLEALAQAEWAPTRVLVVTGSAGGGWAVPVGRAQQAGDRIVYADALVAWTAQRFLLVQGNARLAWSEQPRFAIPGSLQWLLGVAVTVRDAGAL